MPIAIEPLRPYLTQAAQLFAAHYRRLRATVPALPETLCDPAAVSPMLTSLDARRPMLAALQDERLVGYLGWIVLNDFRETARRAALVPEWGWAAEDDQVWAVQRALYRAAATRWAADGIDTHAVSLLAGDHAAREAWFWAGFGLTVVDAARPVDQPLAIRPLPHNVTIRQAGPGDAPLLAELEAEHWQHYAQPPTLMVPCAPDDAAAFTAMLSTPPNSAWLAYVDGQAAGYLRLQAVIDGGAAVLNSPRTIGITGAFVRPQRRGYGLAPALVEAARQFYAAQRDAQGQPAFTCYAVDFESINPEAAAFWPRYFTPVTYSVIRVPEK